MGTRKSNSLRSVVWLCEVILVLAAPTLVFILTSCSRPERPSCAGDLDALFREASEVSNDTLASQEAVQAIGQCPDRRAGEMLADIVLGKVQFVDAQVRSTAIQVLADRGEAGVDSIISEALSPSAIVITRRDVAAALIQTGCGRQCIVNVLSFFERIHKGEPLAEEERFEAARREGIPEDIIEIGAGPARVAQEEVTNMLYETMKKQERLVTEVLSKKYGLGTRAPDPFALEMVKELGL